MGARGAGAPGWWDPNNEGLCVWSAYQPKGAASFAASLVDLSGNGNNAGDPGGANTPGWDAVNGWTFVSVNAEYLTTTFVPQNDQSQSMLGQFTNYGFAAAQYLCGCRGGAPTIDRWYIGMRLVAADIYYGNGGVSNVTPTIAAGNVGVAGNSGYRNGVAEGGAIGAYGVAPTQPLYIGSANIGGGPVGPIDASIQAFVVYDCTLTAPQMLAVATAMAAL